MNRYGYIVLVVAIAAWAGVAIGLGSGDPSGARTFVPPSGRSPACALQPQEHSAALAGTAVDVSPAPETDTANPASQISFRGVPVTDVQQVSVEGSRSGYHHGHLYGYFQGDGGSFVPEKPFDSGETVSVHALIGPSGGERRVSYSFHVATPFPTTGIATFPNPPAPPSSVQSFVSAPELHPPALSVTVPDADPAAGSLLLTSGPGPGQYGPLIYTPQGRLVWFHPLAPGENALDLNMQSYEGQSVLSWWQGRVLASGFGEGEDVVVDHSYQTVATVRAGNGYEADLHDFRLAPGNVAYLTAYNPIRCDLSSAGGAGNGVVLDTVVQQVDVKTGLVRWEWHSLDHVAVSESHAPVPSTPQPWDAFHLNSIDVLPGGDLLVSARSTWAVYRLQAGSGRVLWQLGGTNSSFAVGAGAETAWQHDARLQPDGTLTMFDDGSNPRVHYQSRGVRVAIDPGARSARLLAAYPHPGSPLLSDSQGNMETLPDGNVVIGWGSVPSVSELSAKGQLLLDAHLPPGYSSYRALRYRWSAQPLTPPAVSARLMVTGDATAVFASWNGATDVASWRVLAGPAADALTPRASMPASGFEVSVTYPDAFPYVAVQALAADGHVLATSATARVTGT